MDLPARFLASLGHGLKEIQAVCVVQENVLAAIPTTHQMAHGTGKLNAQLARQGPIVAAPPVLSIENAQCKALTRFRVDTGAGLWSDSPVVVGVQAIALTWQQNRGYVRHE